MEKEIVIGQRKKTPIWQQITSICVFAFLVSIMIFLYVIVPDQESLSLLIILSILSGLIIFINIVTLVSLAKTRDNKTPLAKFTEKSEEIEFYSILATTLKIKKDKIYKITAKKNGQFQVFFYSEINQKLVYNCGFFFDSIQCKEEIKKFLAQKIK